MYDLDGANATTVRPPHVSPVQPGNWARDETAPGANDGTRLTASLVNVLIGSLRAMLDQFGVTAQSGSDDTALYRAVIAAIGMTAPAPHTHDDRYFTEAEITALLAAKVSSGALLTSLADGGGYVRMTDAERTKLASLVANYKGFHTSLSALSTAHPTAAEGDWAILGNGPGQPATVAAWDSDETVDGWVDTGANFNATVDWSNITSKPSTFAPAAHTHPASGISDASANGRSLITAADYAAMRTLLSLGTAALAAVGQSGDALGKLNAANRWSAQQSVDLATLTDGATIAWDVAVAQKAKVTLGGNRSIAAVTNAVEGGSYLLWLVQDATGSRTITWTTTGAGSFDFGSDGTPVLTTTASRADLLAFEALSIGGTLKLRFCGIKRGFA